MPLSPIAEAAVEYARQGLSVILLEPRGKKPQGLWRPSISQALTPEQIGKAFETPGHGDCNVGIVTGAVSGVFVLDFDGTLQERDAIDSRSMPDTLVASTGRGLHWYFKMPGFPVRNAAKILPGADVRGDGGYVVAPPSVHPNGSVYKWGAAYDGTPRAGQPLLESAAPPDWFVDLLPANPDRMPDYIHNVSTATADFIENGAPEGERNQRLFNAACDMAGVGMDLGEAGALLMSAAERAGLPASEARNTLDSAFSQPRTASRPAGAPTARTSTAPVDDSKSDRAMAMRLTGLVRNKIAWASHRKRWMEYDGRVWVGVDTSRAATIGSEALIGYYRGRLEGAERKAERDRLNSLIYIASTWRRITNSLQFLAGMEGFWTIADQWDANPHALNVNNGTIDLRSFDLNPHDPADRFTFVSPTDFDPDAVSGPWADHLAMFLPEHEIRRELQRHLGRALSGVVLDERLPIWYGTGANGKTTTTRAIMAVLGPYARKAAPDLLLEKKNESHPTGVADLAGARLVFSVEPDQSRRLAEGTIKDLTGGDTKKARWMRGDFFEFEQTFDVHLITNHMPSIHGTDPGIWRRVRLIPFGRSVPPDLRRPQEEVLAELNASGSGILNWLLAGLYDVHNDRDWSCADVDRATEDYRADQDILAEFIDARCEIGAGRTVSVGDLYTEYCDWAEADGQRPVVKRTFGAKLRGRGFEQKRDMARRFWAGIALKSGHVTTPFDGANDVHDVQ